MATWATRATKATWATSAILNGAATCCNNGVKIKNKTKTKI